MSVAAAIPMALGAVSSIAGASAASRAAKAQKRAADNAMATQQPYNQFGMDAMNQIKTIQADPGAYIKGNTLYSSMADDAERRLLANQAAKGKVGSGGTKSALQEQLLTLGNSLVNQQIGNLQQQVGTGQNAANQTSDFQIQRGNASAAGIQGVGNALQGGLRSIGSGAMGGAFGNIGSQLQAPTNL